MAIKYDKALGMLSARHITSYTIRKSGSIIGQATWKKLQSGGHIDTRTIDALCKLLDCQPGDFLEFVPDPISQGIPQGDNVSLVSVSVTPVTTEKK